MTNLLFTNFRPLALTSYLKKRRGKSSYRGFLAIHRDDIIALPSSFSTWKNVDDFWALNFLKEAEKLDKSAFDDLKERVRFFLFCKGRVTPRRIRSDSGELLFLTNLGIHPSSQFRRPKFVVGKSLLVLEEELVMYLFLLLNKKNALLIISSHNR